jgi:hypothetical protein
LTGVEVTKIKNVENKQRALAHKIFQNLWYRLEVMRRYSIGTSRVPRCLGF